MTARLAGTSIQGLQTLFHWGAIGNWSDSQLLTLFLSDEEGSEAAFRVLIHRHGPMVLGVCRRVLGDEHAAEDAFQATFLVLVRKARGLQDSNLLGHWLYGVALRVAGKEKAGRARRRGAERQVPVPSADVLPNFEQAELRTVIDEEIKRLPERFRVPLVLCHLEGLRHDEVARRLGCPVGTVESRLSRAREQLRERLERRGLAPTASVLGLIRISPGDSAGLPSLVESTLRLAFEPAAAPAAWKTTIASLGSLLLRANGIAPVMRARAAMSTLVFYASVAILGFAVYRGVALWQGATRYRPEPPPATRFPSAVAYPLTGITIDGKLDDWPKDLPSYPIRNLLVGWPGFGAEGRDPGKDLDPYFKVAYDPEVKLIYLAVVVPDKDVIARAGNATGTDAVEVYIDGNFSYRKVDERDVKLSGERDAALMPVIQYAAVPGPVAAYNDPWRANPSLVYAKNRQTATKMKYQKQNHVTTYEWAIRAFDRFPDRPTHLQPGKRLGLDVAVVDKDDEKRSPAFLTWAPPQVVFKGFDAGSLGELILVDDP
jgi:RNA polymerase sigma factor (sigma-70 family)